MDVSFLQGTAISGATSTFSFPTQNLGTEAPNRYIIVCVQARKGGTVATSVASVTVGGQVASEVIQATTTGTNISLTAIYIAAVPVGTTGNVVVTMSNTHSRCAISLYRATGINPVATFTSSQVGGAASSAMDVLTNGAIITSGTTSVNGASSQVNVTMDFDSSIGANGRATTGSSSKLGQQAGRVVTINFAGSTESIGAFAAFQPSEKGAFLAFFQ